MRNRPAGFGLFPSGHCTSAREEEEEEEAEKQNINMMDWTTETLKGAIRALLKG